MNDKVEVEQRYSSLKERFSQLRTVEDTLTERVEEFEAQEQVLKAEVTIFNAYSARSRMLLTTEYLCADN